MGALASQLNSIEHTNIVIKDALSHLDKKELEPSMVNMLSAAADLAFSDKLLFEKFENWQEDHNDETFLFHVKRFFEKRNQPPQVQRLKICLQ